MKNIIACLILFYIIKELFNKEIAVMYVLLFPGFLTGIKWISVCCISIAMLINICKKPQVKSYILFWIAVLISAFIKYDEGISLGVACILAYLIMSILQKNWRKIKEFIISGVFIGVGVLVFYVIYGIITGVPIVDRIKEWMSVSIGSNSTWATANFGDQASFAFFISYFIVPMTSVALLIFVLVKYVQTKKETLLTTLTVAFSLTEILYITRTIVFHNLVVCSGSTGVLLNFIHWTVSIYVLHEFSEKNHNENIRLLAWTSTMMTVIIIEATSVIHYWPTSDSSLLNRGLKAASVWDLQDDMTAYEGKPRIVFDESSAAMVNQFKDVFDTLLTEDQTFIDFANVTSMYLLTGRTRPCYVGQSPSSLTDLYSQECFLSEIAEYDCPLTVIGTTETSFLQQMVGIPHNVRYYKIAEYIYNNYRPLVKFG